jgi:hypothetical protein
VRERRQKPDRERQHDCSDKRDAGDKMLLHFRTSFQQKADG